MTYMHEAEPYGHLVFDGGDMQIDELALQLARPVAEVKKAMGELEKHGVFSRTESGVIFSRRMVRDKAKEERDKANGKGGGNPKLLSVVNGGVNPEDKAQKPEARDQKEKKYAFECGVVRLVEKDLSAWIAAFPLLDVKAELTGAAPWLGEQENWFNAAAGLLAKRNREVKTKTDVQRQAGEPKYQYGIKGAI